MKGYRRTCAREVMGEVARVGSSKGDVDGKADGDSAEFHSYGMELCFFLDWLRGRIWVYRCPALVEYLAFRSLKEWTFRFGNKVRR